MRRPQHLRTSQRACLVLAVSACLIGFAPREALAAAQSVAVTPTIDTLTTGHSHAPVATVRDGAGAPQSGVEVAFRVIDGGHAIDDLDGDGFTPAGAVGTCTTNASGFCSVSYTGTRVTVDTVQALIDLDRDGAAGDGESAATATVDWRAPGEGASVVRLDMSGCDGDTTAPVSTATWDAAGPAAEVAAVRPVCAARFDAADGLAAGPVTLTIVGGPGVFTDATGAQSLGTSVVVQADGGVNTTYLHSLVTGTTTVRASLDSMTAEGTALWTAGPARTIAISAPAGPPSGSAGVVIATVRDRFANVVPGAGVTFSSDGVGGFAGGAASVATTTGPVGTASAVIETAPGQTGVQTVAASISPADTDCERPAGDPTGAAAGVCRAEAAVTWVEAPPALTLSVSPRIGVWGTRFAISGTLSAGGAGVAGASILVSSRPVGSGPDAWQPLAVATTDETGLYVATAAPSLHTEYRAVFAGDGSFAAVASGTDRGDVRVGLHLNQSAAALRPGQAVEFTGRILPEHPGHPVYLQQLTPAGWRTIATARTGSNSWYRFRVVKRSAGGLLFRTVTPSDFHHAWNASLNRRVDWR